MKMKKKTKIEVKQKSHIIMKKIRREKLNKGKDENYVDTLLEEKLKHCQNDRSETEAEMK